MGLSEWPIDTDPSHSHTHTHTLTLTHSSGQAGRPGRRAGGKGSRRTASAFQLRPQLAHPLTPSHRCPIRPFRIASPHNSLRGMYVEYIRTWPSAPLPRKWPDRGVWVCQRWPAVPCFPCPTETTNFHRGLPLRLTPQPAVLHHKYINDRGGQGRFFFKKKKKRKEKKGRKKNGLFVFVWFPFGLMAVRHCTAGRGGGGRLLEEATAARLGVGGGIIVCTVRTQPGNSGVAELDRAGRPPGGRWQVQPDETVLSVRRDAIARNSCGWCCTKFHALPPPGRRRSCAPLQPHAEPPRPSRPYFSARTHSTAQHSTAHGTGNEKRKKKTAKKNPIPPPPLPLPASERRIRLSAAPEYLDRSAGAALHPKIRAWADPPLQGAGPRGYLDRRAPPSPYAPHTHISRCDIHAQSDCRFPTCWLAAGWMYISRTCLASQSVRRQPPI